MEMNFEQEILVAGIKIVDLLLAPYVKGGKIEHFAGAGIRENSTDHRVNQQCC